MPHWLERRKNRSVSVDMRQKNRTIMTKLTNKNVFLEIQIVKL